jgi:hypothetical protein
MSDVRGFDCFDDMLEFLDAQVAAEEKLTRSTPESWQEAVAPGAYFVRRDPSAGVVIWGRILEPEDDDAREMLDLPSWKGKRFCWAASLLCPEGEQGLIHVAEVDHLISEEQFEAARAEGWPMALPAACAILGFDAWTQERVY